MAYLRHRSSSRAICEQDSMSATAIRTSHLSKQYQIGEIQARYHTLSEKISRTFSWPIRKTLAASSTDRKKPHKTMLALDDVSFDVQHGEVLGIIGRNGAGKSTLLKILSRITEPSRGFAEIQGRVGSLLEVGTGFHPELTGRENIYLNGAVLGMKKREIAGKFDEIVAFAETDQFLDTPVKRYSTGMQTRLAFAVAAHLEPEILLVDEVLSVGDLEFQKKCMGKMGTVAKEGRTILFVSHQLNQVRRLCHRCIWIDGGCIVRDGNPHEVVTAYETEALTPNSNTALRSDADVGPSGFLSWEILGASRDSVHVVSNDGQVTVAFLVRISQKVENGEHGISLYDQDDRLMWGMAVNGITLTEGNHKLCFTLPSLPLRPATYRWEVSLYDGGKLIDFWQCLPTLSVNTTPVTHYMDRWQGILNLPSTFEIR